MTDPFGYYDENSLTGSGTATNAGNVETFPTIEIAGPVTNPSVTVNGINLAYTGTVDAGDTLVIDCEDQTVYIGTTNVIENFTGDFPSFQVGANIVVGTAVFKWRDKYL
jgi:phage-related protein